MKETNLTRGHSAAVHRGWTDAQASAAISPVPVELVNGGGVAVAEGDVVVVLSDGTFGPTTTINDPRPTGVVQDDIDAGDSGPIAFWGPVDLINVDTPVSAGHYGTTSTTARQATDTSDSGQAFIWYTSSGTTPAGFLFGGRSGGVGVSVADIQAAARAHMHEVGEPITADGVSSTYYLANWPEDNTVAVYQAGLRVDVTQSGDAITFSGVPPVNAALRFDYLTELT